MPVFRRRASHFAICRCCRRNPGQWTERSDAPYGLSLLYLTRLSVRPTLGIALVTLFDSLEERVPAVNIAYRSRSGCGLVKGSSKLRRICASGCYGNCGINGQTQ